MNETERTFGVCFFVEPCDVTDEGRRFIQVSNTSKRKSMRFHVDVIQLQHKNFSRFRMCNLLTTNFKFQHALRACKYRFVADVIKC